MEFWGGGYTRFLITFSPFTFHYLLSSIILFHVNLKFHFVRFNFVLIKTTKCQKIFLTRTKKCSSDICGPLTMTEWFNVRNFVLSTILSHHMLLEGEREKAFFTGKSLIFDCSEKTRMQTETKTKSKRFSTQGKSIISSLSIENGSMLVKDKYLTKNHKKQLTLNRKISKINTKTTKKSEIFYFMMKKLRWMIRSMVWAIIRDVRGFCSYYISN